MKINLNTQNMDYDLYKNPVLQVIFPSEFETVNIEQIGMSFENGLRLQSSNMVNNPDGTKTLTIYVTGEQQEYLNNDITACTAPFDHKTIVLTFDLNLLRLFPCPNL